MVAFDRITSDAAILSGQPCIRGMRLTVRRVLEALAVYPEREELRAEYPELEDEDIRQAFEYAAANLPHIGFAFDCSRSVDDDDSSLRCLRLGQDPNSEQCFDELRGG